MSGTNMNESKRKAVSKGYTAAFLLSKPTNHFPDCQGVKVVIVGTGFTGVAVSIAILFKRLASELVLIDKNKNLALAEAEDISHAAAFLGNPRITGTNGKLKKIPKYKSYTMIDYASARDAAVCVISVGDKWVNNQDPVELLEKNFNVFKYVIPNVCKYAPNSVLLVVTSPVDILSYAAMKISGFPPNRVIGLGNFLDSCRFQYFIARKLGIAANMVQATIMGENGSTSVPVWSTVSVMGIKLKDINTKIGTKEDPESWNELHAKVIDCNNDLIKRKGYCAWGIGICVSEIVDAVIRNTCVCMTVSTYLKGCRHGNEKDIFTSLPCVIGRNGVHSLIRTSYTAEEKEQTTESCRKIFELQRTIFERLD